MQSIILGGFFALPTLPAFADNLVMVEAPGCYYCKTWKAEIAPIYPKTEYSELAPLVFVEKKHADEEYQLTRPVIYTPTFLIVNDDNQEIARFEGYQSEDYFWIKIAEVLDVDL